MRGSTTTARRNVHHGLWILLLFGAALGASCSDAEKTPTTTTPKPPPPPSLDPAHCTFETPPKHEASGPAEKGPLKAGYASAVLPMPIGAPLGGYGDRLIKLGKAALVDARKRRFAKSFAPSAGMHDAPRAEAIALEAGGERLAIVRADLPLVNENTLFDLEKAVDPGGAMRGRILLAVSHSHASWAGWQPSLVLMPGIDRPRKDLEDRIVAGLAEAVKGALASLEPASIGVAIEKNFDPTDSVSRDRRGDNDNVIGPDGNTAGKGKDPVVWAMRIDRADGSPLAAFVDVPLHGTVGDPDNPLVSTDAPGGVARALSAALGYPVLHLQGAAGDVSPAGGSGRDACPNSIRCLDMPRLEVVGAYATKLIAPLVTGIKTGSEAALEIVTRTFYSGRGAVVDRPDGTKLEYAPADPLKEPDGMIFDGMGKIISPIDEFNTEVGAGLCGTIDGSSFGPIPGTVGVGAYSSCLDLRKGKDLVFGLFDVDSHVDLPLCDTVRTTVTAIRIAGTPSGDYLIVSVPGEPTAPYTAYLRGRSPAGPDRTLVVGYADDHAGYILTAEDWLAGGYEPSTNIWGPLEGEIILDGILETAKIAWTEEREDPEEGSSRFVNWTYPDATPVDPVVTADHGTAAGPAIVPFWPDTADPAPGTPDAKIERVTGAARFAFWGGDPVVDLPEIFVEKETAPGSNQFEPLKDVHGKPASSYDGAVVVTYVPDPIDADAPTKHLYAALWQPVPPDPFSLDAPDRPYSLPLGVYRLRAKGKAQAASGLVDYEVTSDPFEIVAADLAVGSSASRQTDQLQIEATLGSAPGMRAIREIASDHDLPLPGPWTVTVTFGAGGTDTSTVTPDATGNASIALSKAQVADAFSVEIRDPFGNGGTILVQ